VQTASVITSVRLGPFVFVFLLCLSLSLPVCLSGSLFASGSISLSATQCYVRLHVPGNFYVCLR